MSAKDLSIEPVDDGAGGVRLMLSGELDIACAPRLEAAIEEHIAPGGTLVLDLGAVEFIDSSGLATILNAHKAAESDGWQFALKAPPEPVDRIFDLTDTRDVLRFVG